MAGLNKKHLIIIAGPTAIGKTSLSILLAKHFKCPILSFDSRQFYHEMTIGTAKPTPTELAQAEHHFINSRSVTEVYTSGMFESDALSRLEDIYNNNDIAIAVGGSGLYINALVYGIDDIPSDERVREQLYNRWQTEGLEVLQNEVRKIDPAYFSSADMKNPRRVMRALEVFEVSGTPYSEHRKQERKVRDFEPIWIGLEEELEPLYERINTRVDKMIEYGLVNEVKSLKPNWSLKALKTVGYREIIDYFNGLSTLDEAVELIKRNTRRYARKQFTWFRKNQEIAWFKRDQESEIIAHIQVKRTN